MLRSLALVLALLTTPALAVAHTDKAPEGPVPARSLILDEVVTGRSLAPLLTRLLELSSDGTGKAVDLVIDSPGGSVFAGDDFISVMDEVKAQGTEIRCYVPRLAASMAFQIYLHCTERHALSRTYLLFHRVRVSTSEVITAPVASALALDLQAMDDVIVTDLRRYMGMDGDSFMYHFEHETMHLAENLKDLTGYSFIEVDDVMPGVERLLHPKAGSKDGAVRAAPAGIFGQDDSGLLYIAPWYGTVSGDTYWTGRK
jgi:hypothetical protein